MQQPASTNPVMNNDATSTSEVESTVNTPYHAMETGVATAGDRFEDEQEHEQEQEELASIAPSIVSSVLTADGIHDFTGFLSVCLVVLIGDMSRGVMFPSLWPLVEKLGGTTVTLGYSVAAFSFGRILVSPLFGSWSIRHGYTNTLLFSCSILLFGTLMYAQVENVGRPEFLILAQTCLGIGSGTLGVTRAFVADVTAQRNRTTYMAWITAVQYTGFTVTPFFGALFDNIFGENEYKFGIFRLNMFTAPAYFMTIIVSLTLATLATFFQGRVRFRKEKSNKKKSTKRAQIDDYASQMTVVGLTVYDCCILGCMLLNISTKGSIAAFETLGISIAETKFHMYAANAGTIVASCGSIGVIVLLSMGYLSSIFSDIQLICGGMVVMGLGIVSLVALDDILVNPAWRFVLAIFLIYSIGYPIGHTALVGLFSKIVGRRPQGTLLGWFSSAGSLARLTFPIMSGYIATYEGLVMLFYVLTIVLAISIAVTLYNRSTLLLLSQ